MLEKPWEKLGYLSPCNKENVTPSGEFAIGQVFPYVCLLLTLFFWRELIQQMNSTALPTMENKWGRESPFLSLDIWNIRRDLSAANRRRLPGT